jgi:Trk K+ transport system NAD-binding subunit
LVFLTIAGSVVFAGALAGPLASLLGQRLPGRETVAILGAQGLGLGLAEVLREAGTQVVFLDSNPRNCRQAQEAGFTVVFGDAVQERTLLRARPHSVGAAIGLTTNQMLNSVFVSRARERFGVPRGYVAVQRPESGLAPELTETPDVTVLFEGPHDVERWDVRCRHGSVEIQSWCYVGVPEPLEGEARPKVAERFVILTVSRGGKVQPMHAKLKLQKGDVAAVAVHSVEREEAHETLRAMGWEPQPGESAG